VQVGGFLGEDEAVDADVFDHDGDPDWIAAVLPAAAASFGIEIDPASVVASWVGLYPGTLDRHPIIDRTETGMVIVGGFAGTGLMHAPAAGLLAAELIVDGRIRSIDPAEVSLGRFSAPSGSVEQTGF
jgi:sarcosine oxidase subunit beta